MGKGEGIRRGEIEGKKCGKRRGNGVKEDRGIKKRKREMIERRRTRWNGCREEREDSRDRKKGRCAVRGYVKNYKR